MMVVVCLGFLQKKGEVLKDISVLHKKISDSLSLTTTEKVSVFQDFVLLESEDPSASQNKGALGWISWGRTVSSFQEAVLLCLMGLYLSLF